MFPIAVLVQACDANEDPLSCCISQVNNRLLKYYFLFTLYFSLQVAGHSFLPIAPRFLLHLK